MEKKKKNRQPKQYSKHIDWSSMIQSGNESHYSPSYKQMHSIAYLLTQLTTTTSPTTWHSLRVKQQCVYACIFITAYMYVMRLKKLNVFTLVHRMEGGAWMYKSGRLYTKSGAVTKLQHLPFLVNEAPLWPSSSTFLNRHSKLSHAAVANLVFQQTVRREPHNMTLHSGQWKLL